MTVFYVAGQGPAGRVRIGFTVGRVLGKSVERNRIRRRVRDAVRRSLARLAGALSVNGTSAEIVINPKRSALTVDSQRLVADVEKAFAKVAAVTPAKGPAKEQQDA